MIMQFLIIGLITFLLVFLFYKFFIERFEKTKIYNKPLEKSFVAVFTILSVFLTDAALKISIEPEFDVETNEKNGTIEIKIKITKSFFGFRSAGIDSIFLEYPVMGLITDFSDANPITQAQATAYVSGGDKPPTILNHLELSIQNISAEALLFYTIYYESAKTGSYTFEIVGKDKYQIRYTWKYRGEVVTNTQWRLIKNDEITNPPIARVPSAEFSVGKPLPPQKAIPKRKFE